MLSKYQVKTHIEVPMVEMHCADCDADFEVSLYYATIVNVFDKGSCEHEPHYIFWCPYCKKEYLVRV